MKIFLILLLFLASCATQKNARNTQTGASTQKTIHLLLFAATDDPTIREGCNANISMMKNLVGDAARNGFATNIIEKTGESFDKANLLTIIHQLNPSPSDIVLFHFTGHGKASQNPLPIKKKCPELYVTKGTSPDWTNVTEKQLINAHDIFETLSAKNPKLLLVFIEACATSQGTNGTRTGSSTESQFRQNNIKELFEEKDALLILTCKPSELSYINIEGGLASKKAIETINTENFGGSWRSLFNVFSPKVTKVKPQQHPLLIDTK